MRQSPKVMDGLRVRALQGERLYELTDSQREWVWRSVLKKVRMKEVRRLAGMTDEDYQAGWQRVKGWYERRIREYKQAQDKVKKVHGRVRHR